MPLSECQTWKVTVDIMMHLFEHCGYSCIFVRVRLTRIKLFPVDLCLENTTANSGNKIRDVYLVQVFDTNPPLSAKSTKVLASAEYPSPAFQGPSLDGKMGEIPPPPRGRENKRHYRLAFARYHQRSYGFCGAVKLHGSSLLCS